MSKFKKILVGFDGSESSKNALRQAIALARPEQSSVRAVIIMPAYEGDLELVGVSNIQDAVKGPSEKLVKAAEELAQSESYSISTAIEQGEPYEKLIEVADKENCDLIVMGRRGIGRLERVLMGSVTTRVISHGHQDVLVVPRDASLRWGNILLPTDGSECSKAAVKRAVDAAKSSDSGLTAISVVDVSPGQAEAPQIVEQLEDKAKALVGNVEEEAGSAGVKVQTRVGKGAPHKEIVALAKETNAGVIFMGTHGRSGIKKFITGSITEKVIGFSDIPVFVVKAEK